MVRRATLADVAARSGLSKTAVSLILNDRPGSRLSAEAAERVRQAARELDYRPDPAARSLRTQKTRTVGFISDDVTVTRYASAMIRGALDVAEQHEHTVLSAETGSSAPRTAQALNAMLDRRADGVVFALMAARQIDVPKVPGDLPVVILNGTSGQGHPAVLPAERVAGYEITRLLLDQGHRRIGMIGNSPVGIADPRVSVTLRDRFAGIAAALAEAGVELAATVEQRSWEPELGYLGAHEILRQGVDLTALLCLNDRLAFGAYQALQEHGLRVPRDMSVASFDDDEIASYLRPGLTTARIPYEEMGRQAMQAVLSGDQASSSQRLVPMPIVRRDSVAPVA